MGASEPIPSGNLELRSLLSQADLSNAGLARAVVSVGAREGVHLGTNATSVKRMLDGSQPRWPVPRLVAKALTVRLGFEVTVTDCGFADREDPADTFDGFRRALTIDGTIAVMAELSGRDVGRRNFLLGAGFTAAAFAEPAWFAMSMPAEPVVARAVGRRIGAGDVEVITGTVRHFERLQRKLGGRVVHDQVAGFLHRQASAARHWSYSESLGLDLHRALSQAAYLAGLTSVDSGRHALGQRYYAQSLNLANQIGDGLLAANILTEMSRTTMDVANAAGSQRTIEQHGQHAVGLARSAVQVSGDAATPAFGAWLHAMEARALALLGDRHGAAAAVRAAQRSFERAGGSEPEWFGFYGEADLLADIGLCLRDTGRPRQGLALLERAARALPAGRVTARAKTQIHIAAAYLELGEFEAADHASGEAIAALGAIASNRTVDRVKALRHRAQRHGRHRELRQLDDRLTEFLVAEKA